MRPRLKTEESGFTLIEVLVSALLVSTIAIGVLASIDSSSTLSGRIRNRGEASSIAQGEQERLRSLKTSTLDAAALASAPGPAAPPQYQPASPTIRGQTYTIKSWVWKVSQSAATSSTCSGASAAANHYLRIRTQVTWVGQPSGVPPAREESVVPVPPGGSGSLVVTIKDAQATPAYVGGVTVSVDGGSPQTTTAANGCVEWDDLLPNSHTVTFSKAGYMTPDGQTSVSRVVSVSDASRAYANFTFAPGASVTLPFYYMNGGTRHTATGAGHGWDQVTVTDTDPLNPQSRVFGTAGAYSPTLSLANLVGFPTPYSVAPGTCPGLDPAKNGQAAFTLTWNAGTSSFTMSDVNGLQFPSYASNWKFKWGAGATRQGPATGGNLYFYRKADTNGCPAMTLGPFVLDGGNATDAAVTFPVLPYGTYSSYCGEYYEDGSDGTSVGWWNKSVTPPAPGILISGADLTTSQPIPTQTITSSTSAPNGQCPP